MIIHLSKPFRGENGKREIEINLKKQVKLNELFEMLSVSSFNGMNFIGKLHDPSIGAHVMVLRSGKPLNMNDVVSDKDVISIFMPVTGG